MSRLNSAIRNIHRLDDLAARDSFLTRLHPLAKLLATVAYLVATLSFTRHDLTGLLGMSLPLILLYQVEGLSILGCLRQFRPVLVLLAAVGAANLLFAKEPAVQLGGFAVSGAWITFAVLLGKGVFCFLAVYLLMESTGINGVCCALQQLHVPRVMVVTLLLIYRYLILLLQEGGRISTAYALRAPGQIAVCGLEMNRANLKEIRRRIGYVFQDSDSQLFMPTVYADVAFAAENYGLPQEEVRRRTQEALELVHMQDYAQRQVYRLSGGQKKLAAIAGILTLHPELILMDEPSAALDPKNRRNLIHILNSLPCAKLIASHDLDFIYETCDKVVLLHQGKVAASGPAAEILGNGALLEQCDLELPLMMQGLPKK